MGQMSKGVGPAEFLSTYPRHETRIDQLKQWMPQAMGLYQAKQAMPAAAVPSLH